MGIVMGVFLQWPIQPALGDPAARSVVPRRDHVVYLATSTEAPVVGRLDGAPMPLVAASPSGGGCRRSWFQVGPGRWICGEGARASNDAPDPPPSLVPDPMGWSYGVTVVRTMAYHSLEDARSSDPQRGQSWSRWQGFAIRAVHRAGGDAIVETMTGQFVARRAVASAPRSDFHGVTLGGDSPPGRLAWVVARRADLYADATSAAVRRARVARLPRHAAVVVQEVQDTARGPVARLADGRWARVAALRLQTPQAPPPGVDVRGRQRWIDVDLDQQVLTAYEGAAPVYATLVSTGDPETPTPAGVYRIWLKRVDQPMGYAVGHPHVLAEVPYVQFFDHDGRALHGVYWHRSFGRPRSHGCVNLSFADARWMFEFTSPLLPDGWRSIGGESDVGTVVRVRGRTPGG